MNLQPFTPTVKLRWITPDADQMIADLARVSVKDADGKPAERLIRYMADHKHWSPFDMVNMCVEVHAPRDISRQILRHSSMKFQEFCISGDSNISVRLGNTPRLVTIADLYARQQAGDYNGRRGVVHARVYDETTQELVYVPVREVFATGVKPVYSVAVGNDKPTRLKATMEHKFLCRDGVFRPLHDIAVGDFVARNGTAVWHSAKTTTERRRMKQTIHWGRVQSIEYVGEEATYDLEVEHRSHNYVANGLVVHNSQRYAEVTSDKFVAREARAQHPTNRQMSVQLDPADELLEWWNREQARIAGIVEASYLNALARGIAKECARVILPEGNTMSRMMVNGTARSWITYLMARTDIDTTQREHVQVADMIATMLRTHMPLTYRAFFLPRYQLQHAITGVVVCEASSEEDVRAWAKGVQYQQRPVEDIVHVFASFQPGIGTCRVIWLLKSDTAPVQAFTEDYNLIEV